MLGILHSGGTEVGLCLASDSRAPSVHVDSWTRHVRNLVGDAPHALHSHTCLLHSNKSVASALYYDIISVASTP